MLRITARNVANFENSGPFELSPGINVIVGINNSGKTALLWTLSMLGTFMSRDETPGTPKGQSAGWVRERERRLQRYLRADGNIAITVEHDLDPVIRDLTIKQLCDWAGNPKTLPFDQARETFEWNVVRSNGNGEICLLEPVNVWYNRSGERKKTSIFHPFEDRQYFLTHPFDEPPPDTWAPSPFAVDPYGAENGARLWRLAVDRKPGGLEIIWPAILSSVAVVSANRVTPEPEATKKQSLDLQPDIRNLAQVLSTMQLTTPELRDGRKRFAEIEADLCAVFPEVTGVRTEGRSQPNITNDDSVEIMLDLARGINVSLTNSGSGVQQILALLCAAYLRNRPSLFLIDEPHSFLHPAAERTLLRILERLGKEQGHIFCIATHSPIMASHARRSLWAISNLSGSGQIANLANIQDVLALLGVQASDIFTYDRVLFVEGDSDVSAMRAVLSHFDAKGVFERTKLVGVVGDGHFKKPKSAAHLRKLLTEASAAPFNTPVGFLFDGSNRKEEEIADFRRALDHRPSSVFGVLQQGDLEDYLLEPEVVCRLIDEERKRLGLERDPNLPSFIRATLKADGKAADRLEKCFSTIEGWGYQKTIHGPALAKAILDVAPNHLKPLFNELEAFLNSMGESSKAQAAQ
jgi:hypothetical protein